MVSKLAGIAHKNGEIEDEENSKDYIALHVYPNKQEGSKVLIDKGALQRSSYSPEQTIKFSLELSAREYMNTGQVLNLVID